MLHSPAFANKQNLIFPETSLLAYSNKAVIHSRTTEGTYISPKCAFHTGTEMAISLIKGHDSILTVGPLRP